MELLLIRHALPIRRENEPGTEAADPELSEIGRDQARFLAEYLRDERIDAVYSSPMQRARETAAPIARVHGLEVIIDEGIAEFDRNSHWYVPVEELKASNDPRWHEMLRGGGPYEDVDPETFRQVVVHAVERLIEANPSKRIAAVCHGGVINAYLTHILGIADPTGFFYPNYTSIHRIMAARTGERTILTLNETFHLKGTGLPVGLFG